MISWIVASHDEEVLSSQLGPSLASMPGGDELVVVCYAPSITVAYARGQGLAENPVRCYVHSDVRVLDLPRLRRALLDQLRPSVGIVGIVGSRTSAMPWWEADKLGSVVDTRLGRLDWGPGGPCAMLDGLLLATRQDVAWDTDAPGWHGYDHDACAQMLNRGLPNLCVTGGAELVEHDTGPFGSRAQIAPGWGAAVMRWRSRWT